MKVAQWSCRCIMIECFAELESTTPPQAQCHLQYFKHHIGSAQLLCSKVLGEIFLLSTHIREVSATSQDPLSNVLVVDPYVFLPQMKHKIMSQLDATKLVTIYDNMSVHIQP